VEQIFEDGKLTSTLVLGQFEFGLYQISELLDDADKLLAQDGSR
jgi:hypothetical protein